MAWPPSCLNPTLEWHRLAFAAEGPNNGVKAIQRLSSHSKEQMQSEPQRR
jgi:hypothetical protein